MLSDRINRLDGEWRKAGRSEEFVRHIANRLGESRLLHSVSVARVSWAVAADLGLDGSLAVTAGLLHDLCKGMKNETMLEAAARYGIAANPIQARKPNLLHGHVAAEESRRMLSVQDPEVYEAIFWHVTGRAGLGRMGQALYFADFSEPHRTHPEAAEARALYDAQGFDAALRFVAGAKLSHLRAKGALIDPDTEAFQDWLNSGDPR